MTFCVLHLLAAEQRQRAQTSQLAKAA